MKEISPARYGIVWTKGKSKLQSLVHYVVTEIVLPIGVLGAERRVHPNASVPENRKEKMENLLEKPCLEEQVLRERKKRAKDFLQTVIYEALGEDEEINGDRLSVWLDEYKRKNPGPGDDFGVSTLFGQVFEHLERYPSDILERDEPLPRDLIRDLKVLDLLCELELENVEQANI